MKNVTEIGLPLKDIQMISEVINHHPEKDLSGLVTVLRFILETDIKPGHYIALGFLISERVNTVSNARKSNFFTQWQRPN
jgi:hypothetical protein